jgi:ubiquinone/menaquinone biosynthesis C-methylase UbiE
MAGMNEERFHDNWAGSINPSEVLVDESFLAATCPENRIILNWLGRLEGRKILDLGCGAGEAAAYFAKQDAIVTAADISKDMLNVADKVSELHGVKIELRNFPAEHIDFSDGTFDIIYAANLLHHADDIEKVLKEVHRTLKKGGIAVFYDPLAHNPIIGIYRLIVRGVRTKDEHPIKFSQIRYFKSLFSDFEYKTTWFFALWIFMRFFIIELKDPSKERYWKIIVKEHRRLEKTYRRLERFDGIFLNAFPVMRRFCWNIVIKCVK